MFTLFLNQAGARRETAGISTSEPVNNNLDNEPVSEMAFPDVIQQFFREPVKLRFIVIISPELNDHVFFVLRTYCHQWHM